MTQETKEWISALVSGFSLGVAVMALAVKCSAHPQPEPTAEPEPAPIVDTLSDWQMTQMAIMMTESRFNPKATGATQDAGIFQLTPIYVREANRIAGTDYAHNDAYDPLKSLYMFSAVQDHRNPEHDLNKAIKLHNPGGAAIGYPAKVKSNLEFIKRYEAARSAVKDYELRKSNADTARGE